LTGHEPLGAADGVIGLARRLSRRLAARVDAVRRERLGDVDAAARPREPHGELEVEVVPGVLVERPGSLPAAARVERRRLLVPDLGLADHPGWVPRAGDGHVLPG